MGAYYRHCSVPPFSRRAPREALHAELEGLYGSHRAALVQSASALLGCPARAEDVVHDAFLKLWESGEQLAIDDALKYLFRTVRNLCIDRLRRLALEGRHQADEAQLDELPSPEPSPERGAIGRLSWQRMIEALGELPPRTREAFTMSQLEGYSQREVASHLQASPTLVHFLVRDAVGHCRSQLGELPT